MTEPIDATAACPTACTPRPRDPDTYRAACTAAQGEPVVELDAAAVVPGMRIWHAHRFLTVLRTHRRNDTVTLDFDARPDLAARVLRYTDPLYRITTHLGEPCADTAPH